MWQPLKIQIELQYLLWAMSILLQTTCAAFIVIRRLRQEFPLFYAYTLFHVFSASMLLLIRFIPRDPRFVSQAYFIFSWGTEILTDVLAIAVVHEIQRHAFADLQGLQQLGVLLMRWAGGVLIMLAAISAALAQSAYRDPTLAALLSFDHGAAVVTCGLLFFLFAFCSYFRISWRHYVFGLALGLALYNSVDIILIVAVGQAGSATRIVSIVRSGAYNCALLTWLAYLWTREKSKISGRRPGHDLEDWNRALLELLS